VPAQVPAPGAGGLFFWLLVHRTPIGRGVRAIGFSPEGARFAGIPVARRLLLVYVLSGAMAGLAAVVYAARLGQAKADAGSGYELFAITAVVLGGTSIFGGRGSVHGTLLGLIAVALPAERPSPGRPARGAGGDPHRRPADRRHRRQPSRRGKESGMRRLGFALGLAVIAVACGGSGGGGASGGGAAAKEGPTVAMMPKNKGNPYFVSCHKGGQEAADQLGVKLLWDGPTETDPAKQNEVVEAWITRGVDVIAVSVENKEAISTVLRKARAKGIKVVTWDADAEKDARDVFVDQATPQGIASVLLEHTSRLLGARAPSRSSRRRSPPPTRTSGSRTSRSSWPRSTPT
jgi:rhamnose transport system permease protein